MGRGKEMTSFFCSGSDTLSGSRARKEGEKPAGGGAGNKLPTCCTGKQETSYRLVVREKPEKGKQETSYRLVVREKPEKGEQETSYQLVVQKEKPADAVQAVG